MKITQQEFDNIKTDVEGYVKRLNGALAYAEKNGVHFSFTMHIRNGTCDEILISSITAEDKTR